ncbi:MULTISPECIES: SulP family inorganic anion transporter [Anaerotruncus]|uniref:SulP family inorganic anion transporter n=1 Tax=Anaerotruncus TaxID=244127 RepID=UPI0026A99033
MRNYWQDLKKEFAGYNSGKLMKDLMAGMTVAAVALPLALAFGVSSGATAAAGLITAIVSGFSISLLGGAFYQISGPTGAMAAILISIIAQYGISGVFTATIMAGILLVLAGVLHLGRLTAYIPMPVIAGFTSGISVIIALGQLDNLFGVTSTGDSALEKFISYFSGAFSPNWISLAIGMLVILFMVFYPKKWNAVVPASLIAIILATAFVMLFHLKVNLVGEIPSSLILSERFSFAEFDLSSIRNLLAPAVSVAALGMVESLLCGASAGRMTGVRLNNDRELVAQGVGNILSPLLGGIPATAAIARTSVAIKSGAQTRLTGIFHSVILLISMLALGPIMAQIPLSALAGVLLVTAWRMNEWDTIKYIFSRKFEGAILKFLATMAATILFDLTIAILIGVVIALILLVSRLSKLEVNYDRVDPSRLRNQKTPLSPVYDHAEVVYITGAVIFANTQIITSMAERLSDKSAVLFSMRGASYMDISGAQAFLELLRDLQEKGIPVYICGVSNGVKEIMDRSGIVSCIGQENFYWSVERALNQ